MGIEDVSHVILRLEKGIFHLKEVVTGVVDVELFRIKGKECMLSIVKGECLGKGPKCRAEREVMGKF